MTAIVHAFSGAVPPGELARMSAVMLVYGTVCGAAGWMLRIAWKG
ncbi:hypothetical protein [Actinomadura terrae]|nr:hypothetical protein [Actinomadura terrae]